MEVVYYWVTFVLLFVAIMWSMLNARSLMLTLRQDGVGAPPLPIICLSCFYVFSMFSSLLLRLSTLSWKSGSWRFSGFMLLGRAIQLMGLGKIAL